MCLQVVWVSSADGSIPMVILSVTLKKELSVQDWLRLFDEVKDTVDRSLRKDDSTSVNG